MKTGLFGGTFDPIHIGHLIAAEDVRLKLQLDRVIFMPARQPWLKMEREIAGPQYRLDMVKLATATNPFFEVSEAEIQRNGPSYTIDTVELLRAGAGNEEDIFFIAGTDAIADMPRWKDPERIVTLCNIVAMKRPGAETVDASILRPHIPRIDQCLITIDVPQVEITSTMIRGRVKSGFSIRYLVPPEVEDYIYENKLYVL